MGEDDPLATSPAVTATAQVPSAPASRPVVADRRTAAGQRLGTLALGGVERLEDGQGRTVERAAMVTALVLLFRLRAAEADQRVRTDLLADLLGRGRGPADATLVDRGRLLGLRLLVPHVVAVCRCTTRPRGLPVAAARSAAGRGLSGEHDGLVVAVLPGEDASAVAADLAARLGEDGPPVTVGAAGPVVPAHGLREAYAQARRTADALLALGMSGRGGSVRDLGFAGLVRGPGRDVDDYVRGVLGPLLDYDARRGSRLVRTVEAYFASGGSPLRAAGTLHVHVNTVAQRLERVAALLGEDWQEPDRALDVQLALRLQRLRDGPST